MSEPVIHCPGCGSDIVTAVSNGIETNFFCQWCSRCWHVELGYVTRVDPMGCPGCPSRLRCRAASERDADPRWWPPRARYGTPR